MCFATDDKNTTDQIKLCSYMWPVHQPKIKFNSINEWIQTLAYHNIFILKYENFCSSFCCKYIFQAMWPNCSDSQIQHFCIVYRKSTNSKMYIYKCFINLDLAIGDICNSGYYNSPMQCCDCNFLPIGTVDCKTSVPVVQSIYNLT